MILHTQTIHLYRVSTETRHGLLTIIDISWRQPSTLDDSTAWSCIGNGG